MPVVCDYASIFDGVRRITPGSDFTATFNPLILVVGRAEKRF